MLPVLIIHFDLEIRVKEVCKNEEFLSGQELDNVLIGIGSTGDGADRFIQHIEAGYKSNFF